jgi:superfamily II DNA or RNA helicase
MRIYMSEEPPSEVSVTQRQQSAAQDRRLQSDRCRRVSAVRCRLSRWGRESFDRLRGTRLPSLDALGFVQNDDVRRPAFARFGTAAREFPDFGFVAQKACSRHAARYDPHMSSIPPAADRVTLAFDQGTLTLCGARPEDIRRSGEAGIWKWDSRVACWRTHALHYAAARARLRHVFGGAFDDQVPVPERVRWPKLELLPLRPEQLAAVESWTRAQGRGQIVMPTGTGKTEVALAAIVAAGVATLVVAPVRDLMYQWQHRILRRTGYDAGIVGDSLFNLRAITVTTYDSAYIHMARIGATFGLIVFDEEHHLPGRCYREAALLCAAPLRLGLTATPERADGLHSELNALVGPVVYDLPLSAAKGGTLADYTVVRIPVALQPQEQARYDRAGETVRRFMYEKSKTTPGYTFENLCADAGKDPEARNVQKAYYLKRSIEDRAEEKLRVLEDLFGLHSNERILVFAGSNAMALDISRRFLVPTLLSFSRKKERIAVLEGFAAGTFPVVVANQVLDEGVDVPAAKVAVVVGGQASARQAKQRLGRILRKSGGLRATLYEVVCEDTKDVERSRERRRSDAYERTVHHRL